MAGFCAREEAVTVSTLALIGWVVLWALLWTLTGLLALLLLLLLLLLFVPVSLHLRIDSDLDAPDWEAESSGSLRWLLRFNWGGVILTGSLAGEGLTLEAPRLRLFGLRLNLRSQSRSRPGAAREKKVKKRRRSRPNLSLRLIKALLDEALRLPKRLWQSLGLQLEGDITYGFSDPSITGFWEAIRWGARVPIPIRLIPAFQRQCFVGYIEVKSRVYGFRLAALAFRSLRNPVIWNHWVSRIRFRPLRQLLLQGGS